MNRIKLTAQDISRNAIIAALYVVLTMLTYPFSFGMYQLRIAEMLVLLCFFRKDYTLGVTIGCAIVNMFSEIGFMDVLFGTLATLISCLIVCYCKHLLVSCLFPIFINSFLIGLELFLFGNLTVSYFLIVGFVALGELGAIIIGYIICIIFRKRPHFLEYIHADQNLDFKI